MNHVIRDEQARDRRLAPLARSLHDHVFDARFLEGVNDTALVRLGSPAGPGERAAGDDQMFVGELTWLELRRRTPRRQRLDRCFPQECRR